MIFNVLSWLLREQRGKTKTNSYKQTSEKVPFLKKKKTYSKIIFEYKKWFNVIFNLLCFIIILFWYIKLLKFHFNSLCFQNVLFFYFFNILLEMLIFY